LDAEEEAGSVGDRGVAFAGLFGGGGERPDHGGVDLLEIDEREFLSAEGGLEFFAVFEDVFASVPVGEAEIENFLSVEIGDAAGTVLKPWRSQGSFLKASSSRILRLAEERRDQGAEILAARWGAKVAGRLCDAAEKISKRRASSKYNRKWNRPRNWKGPTKLR